MPKYSFVIPVYNSEPFLVECVNSVLAQSFPDYEMLLIDDGSTDGSGRLCDLLAMQDDRIRVFHKENGGAASARNIGIEYALGQYILFVDGDDTVEQDCLEVIEQANCDGESLPIFGMCFDYWRDDRIARTEVCSVANPGRHTISEVANNLSEFFNDNALSSACNKVFPIKILRDRELRFQESMILYEDFEFVITCLPYFGSVNVIPRGLYHYRNQTDKTHLDRRVSDLACMKSNLATLNGSLVEFGLITGKSKKSAAVLANLYVMLLEQHLLSKGPSVSKMRRDLPQYLSEKNFRVALASGIVLDVGKQKLLAKTEKKKFFSIWLEYAVKRLKRKIRRTAKLILRQ